MIKGLNYKVGFKRLYVVAVLVFVVYFVATNPGRIGETVGYQYGLFSSEDGYWNERYNVRISEEMGDICRKYMDGKGCDDVPYDGSYGSLIEQAALKESYSCWSEEGKAAFLKDPEYPKVFKKMSAVAGEDVSSLNADNMNLDSCEIFIKIRVPSSSWIYELILVIIAPMLIYMLLLWVYNGFKKSRASA